MSPPATAADPAPGTDPTPVVDPVTGEPLPDSIKLPPLDTDRPPRILVIDNYDSFTYNLVQYLGEQGANVMVHRNDAITLDDAAALEPDGIVISPGPGNPKNERDFGVSGPILTELSPAVPTMGVCLGLQGFAHLYGGDVAYADQIMHGKTSVITHDSKGLFHDVPTPLTVGRYHSLVADPNKVPDVLEISATTETGEVMGLRHRTHPIECVQFHPESILTQHGKTIIRNFLQRTLDHRTPEATA